MDCRPDCGACCIAPSISSPIPGMPKGKPAGVPCIHLTNEFRCGLFGNPTRPEVCAGLAPEPEMCGPGQAHALSFLALMERKTSPT